MKNAAENRELNDRRSAPTDSPDLERRLLETARLWVDEVDLAAILPNDPSAASGQLKTDGGDRFHHDCDCASSAPSRSACPAAANDFHCLEHAWHHCLHHLGIRTIRAVLLALSSQLFNFLLATAFPFLPILLLI